MPSGFNAFNLPNLGYDESSQFLLIREMPMAVPSSLGYFFPLLYLEYNLFVCINVRGQSSE